MRNPTIKCRTTRPGTPLGQVHADLQAALIRGDEVELERLAAGPRRDRRDAALCLAVIHDLHLAPIDSLGDVVRFQHHPAISALKARLEADFVRRLDRGDQRVHWKLPDDPVAALRAVSARDQVPVLYRWLAEKATIAEVREFLRHEGGPDGGFDDLVALCQIGLDGPAKLELARNYWDEMGRGTAADVHTELYRRFIDAAALAAPPLDSQPVELLERNLLGSLLATNRQYQPEMVGALGLIELQAGPRCRRILAAFDRLGFAPGAYPFYREHAATDPRHGKDWLDHAVGALGRDRRWAAGIVRGARWRWLVNDRFFAVMGTRSAVAGDRRHESRSDNPRFHTLPRPAA